jgi:hypothetical protein
VAETSQKFTLDEEPESVLAEVVEEAEVSTSLQLPEGARIPEGATLYEGPDDTCCRVIHADGRRCLGIRMKDSGLCPPHAGRSRVVEDPRAMQRKGAEAKVKARERRAVLVSNGLNPRRAAREQAIRRSDAMVRALVDDPLDDEKLTTMQRQRAVLEVLDATFPLAHVSAEIELPATAEGVQQLGWAEMQRLAAQLLPELEQGGT